MRRPRDTRRVFGGPGILQPLFDEPLKPLLGADALRLRRGLERGFFVWRQIKRTGFVVGILFLEVNGYRFTASEEDTAHAVLELAAGKLDEAGYSAFLRAHVTRNKR
jgi:hypothetical protein